jgi:LmbE family N-acetylglucosaminyl deacetylase
MRRALLQRWFVPALCRPTQVSPGAAMIFAPHQDDETLGCGGLIALKRRQGTPVSVVFLTDGSHCHGDVAEPAKQALVVTRREEALSALGHLGVSVAEVDFLNYPDGGLGALADAARTEMERRLAEIIHRGAPEEIYVPHRRDSHPDHEAAFRLVAAAIRASSCRPIVYEYPVWLLWSRTRLFDNLRWSDLAHGERVAVGTVLDAKRSAIAEYRSQLELFPPGFVTHFLTGNELFFRSRGADDSVGPTHK